MFNKKKLIMSSIMVGLLLSACGETTEESTEQPADEATPAEQTPMNAEESSEQTEVSEPKTDESGNTILDEVGQTATSEAGTVELKKIINVNETVDIAPLTVTVQDIKILEMSDVDPDFAESLTWQADADISQVQDGFTYVQVRYQAENTEDQNIEWYDLMNITTDQGEQIDAQLKDFLVDDADMDSQFIGKVKKEYVDAFILKNPDVNSIKLIYGYTMSSDTYEDITGEQTVEYSFE